VIPLQVVGFPVKLQLIEINCSLFQAMDKPSCVPERESEVILFYELGSMNSPFQVKYLWSINGEFMSWSIFGEFMLENSPGNARDKSLD
jgi:hypothetical protein